MFPLRSSLLLGLSCALAAVPAAADPLAFRLAPMSRDFAPAGQGASQTFEIANPGDAPIAIATHVKTRTIDERGAERNDDADREWFVYPAQVIVPARGRQVLRVSWMGSARPEKELAYRLEVEQVPLSRVDPRAPAASSSGTVRLVLRYLASLYVRPAEAHAQVKVKDAGLQRDVAGKPRLRLVLVNTGAAHASLRDFTIRIRASGTTAVSVLRPFDSLPTGAGAVVLPGDVRNLEVPWPAGVAEGPVDIALGPPGNG